jgi:3-oxoacyl-[acyl-carrier-protein] synthase-3
LDKGDFANSIDGTWLEALFMDGVMDGVAVGVVSAASRLPSHKHAIAELFQVEGVDLTEEIISRLGVDEVPLCNGESGSDLAVAAAREALERAGIAGSEVNVVVDYTILPQEYMVPVWNMSGKVQHEVGAESAFTIGFSGGGSSNFLVALNFAAAMLAADEKMKNALLVAADVTIPGNRVLNPSAPVSVLGDGASAVVLQRGATAHCVLDTELCSDGSNHDVYCIPGGCLANPEDPSLYRLVLDKARYDAAPKTETLLRLAQRVLDRASLGLEDIKRVVYTNVSAEDQAAFQQTFGLGPERMCTSNLAGHGHLQGTDLVLNYLSTLEDSSLLPGDPVLICSHGMGFMAGVSLIEV